jgi:radical SAM superfamily enzyme YgiQ (UPF0313 family)
MLKRLSITLVQCPAWGRDSPPLAISLLGANLRTKDFEVYLFDMNIEFFRMVTTSQRRLWSEEMGLFWSSEESVQRLMEEYNDEIEKQVSQIIETGSQLVGFTLYASSIFFSLEIIKQLKERSLDTLVVVGGPSTAEYTGGLKLLDNPDIDAIVLREGDITVPEMCAVFREKGHLEKIAGLVFKDGDHIIHGGERKPVASLDSIPFPDYAGFDLNRYNNPECLNMFSSRGCINRCYYCNEQKYFGRFRVRSGKSLFEEVQYHLSQHPDVKLFFFCDSVLNGSLKTVREFSDLLLKTDVRISWGGFAILRKEMDSEILKLMAKAGCAYLIYGIESGSETVRKSMNKIRFTNEIAVEVLKATHNAGIQVFVDFMFGYPTETEEDFQMTLDFLHQNYKWIDQVFPSYALTALLPNSYLYENPEEFEIEEPNTHIIFWETKDVKNTYLTRLDRYERFCKLCINLGFEILDPEEREEKWKLLGDYYRYKKDYEKAIECYIKDLLKYGHSFYTSNSLLESVRNYERADISALVKEIDALINHHGITMESLKEQIMAVDRHS